MLQALAEGGFVGGRLAGHAATRQGDAATAGQHQQHGDDEQQRGHDRAAHGAQTQRAVIALWYRGGHAQAAVTQGPGQSLGSIGQHQIALLGNVVAALAQGQVRAAGHYDRIQRAGQT